jgi:hypothetical protein
VLIPGRLDLQGNIQTLTEFALRHAWLRADDIRPRSRTATPLPATLDGAAVVQLVRQLDRKPLPETPRHPSRGPDRRQPRASPVFCRQLPWQVLQYAHEQTLQERLSASAWGLIQQVFDMPDALARAAVPAQRRSFARSN